MAGSEFEELDKAVASVLGTSPAAVTPPAQPEPVAPEPPVQATPVSPAVAPRPRATGRFMDVMHPSSDMRPQASTPAQPEPVVQPAPAPVQPAEPVHPDQPDPLDFQGFTVEPEPAENQPVAEDPEPATETPTTPFLTDAKVEKRPLGAFSDTPKPDEDAKPTEPPELTDEQKEAALPAELHNDLLSIEASEQQPVPAVSTQEAPPVPSIVQQYQEKPSSDTTASAAIYDTESNHVPLVHAPAKRSKWLIVVWIAALVLVGSGVGVTLYFVVLPMLG